MAKKKPADQPATTITSEQPDPAAPGVEVPVPAPPSSEPPVPEPPQEETPEVDRGPELKIATVVLRRPATIGNQKCAAGTPIGQVKLAPGVSLNYLVDAVRCDLATEEE